MLLVMSGSILSAMEQIFSDRSEPLYGRTSGLIEVKPFTPRINELPRPYRRGFEGP